MEHVGCKLFTSPTRRRGAEAVPKPSKFQVLSPQEMSATFRCSGNVARRAITQSDGIPPFSSDALGDQVVVDSFSESHHTFRRRI